MPKIELPVARYKFTDLRFVSRPQEVHIRIEYAAHLAAHRIEILAGGLRTDGVMKGSEDGPAVNDGLIGDSELMREVRKDILIAARLNLSALINGEPGTGKENVAQGIHKASSRAGKPSVAVQHQLGHKTQRTRCSTRVSLMKN